jgi:hypothetical protein
VILFQGVPDDVVPPSSRNRSCGRWASRESTMLTFSSSVSGTDSGGPRRPASARGRARLYSGGHWVSSHRSPRQSAATAAWPT